jgi:diguanylate cyclase (GGDEF)-like protein/PAS domain S-box-containing protein
MEWSEQEISKELNKKQQLLDAIFEVANVGICVTNEDGIFELVNDAYCRIYGYTKEELLGKPFTLVVPNDLKERATEMHRAFIEGEPELNSEWKVVRKDGRSLDVYVTAGLLVQEEGAKLKVTTVTDMTEIKEAHKSLELVSDVLSNANEGIVFTGSNPKDVLYMNGAFTRITGVSEEDFSKDGIGSIFDNCSEEGQYCRNILPLIKEYGLLQEEITIKKGEGKVLAAELTLRAVKDPLGSISNYVLIVNDITKKKKAEEKIRYLTTFSSITDLPNRHAFEDTLDIELKHFDGSLQMKISVIIFDLDKFKNVNDNYGYAIGDMLLRAVGARIKNCIKLDYLVAYLGEDHFGVLLNNIPHKEAALEIAKSIQEAMTAPFFIDENEISITGSIGISIFPDESHSESNLISDAEKAMSEGKAKGRNYIQLYNNELDEKISRRLRIKNDLKRCIKRNQLFLVYQPQIDLKSGRVVGVEALLRWRHSIYGLVPPDEFIPIAEETGFITEIGEWVIKEACIQAKKWQNNGVAPFKVAVNLSSIQLKQTNISQVIKDIIEDIGVTPGVLELELTESSMMQDIESCIITFNELKQIGIKIAIDDFGTGYSSLSYLRKIPINKLKIDRSFIMDVGVDFESSVITKTIIDMAQNLGFKVIAEGAETQNQIEYLRDSGCDEIQGYYYSKPLPPEELEEFIKRQ